MFSRLIYAALSVTGITTLARRLRGGGVILCYHNTVAPGESAGDPGVHMAVADFARQVSWVAAHYDVVPLVDVARRLREGRSLRGLAALTLDDGYEGVFTHAWPILRNANLPATVFIPTNFMQERTPFWWDHPAIAAHATDERRTTWLEQLKGDGDAIARAEGATEPPVLPSSCRPASWETIRRAAAEGFDIGLHSASHRTMPRLSDDELHREVVVSRAVLAERTGVEAAAFAYPYGRWDARVRDVVKQSGFDVAVTLDAGLNDEASDPWALRRVNVPASISAPAFAAWTAGISPALWAA